MKCISGCILIKKCKTFNFEYSTGTCELLNVNSNEVGRAKAPGWTHYETDANNKEVGFILHQTVKRM